MDHFSAVGTDSVMVGFVLDFKKSFAASEVNLFYSRFCYEVIKSTVDGNQIDVGEGGVEVTCRQRLTTASEVIKNFFSVGGEAHRCGEYSTTLDEWQRDGLRR